MATRRFRKKQVVPRIVNSVTGTFVDNTDPENPIINIPSGAGDKHWIHDQAVSSNYWVCPHTLNKVVAVTSQDTNGNPVSGEIVKNNGIVVEIKFKTAFAGKAYFN